MSQSFTGSCLCKNITYRIDLPASEPVPEIVLCHCTNCKHYTGSGFSANIIVPQTSLNFTEGTPKLYLDRNDRGGQVRRTFCANCGSPLTSQPSGEDRMIVVKSGTLDDESRANCGKLSMEIYHQRKDRWTDALGQEGVQRINGMW
ncbi:hypothetical protein NUU61_004548 [Penicillium alfredii]|uniref:CENP-V/GFA domain-containing protein n=1 Tax=Penicillium alfredii TaxID=1506179 RepID=A0A9W9FLB9_9EURO|nr:uncharacterized protein NUU61_004548 [Penicillium alfredii]KAJ5102326.1 hypothetical protein NUU61_004548 [Penicillium alfredii]